MPFPSKRLTLPLAFALAMTSAPALAHLDQVHPTHLHAHELAGWALLAVLAIAFMAWRRARGRGGRPASGAGMKRPDDGVKQRRG